MKATTKPAPVVHVIFTIEGIPGWFGPEAVPGSEAIYPDELAPYLPEGVPPESLAAHCRAFLVSHIRLDGQWLPRPPDLGYAAPEAAVSEEVTIEEAAVVDPDPTAA